MRTEQMKSAGRLVVMLFSAVVLLISSATTIAEEKKEILPNGRTWTTKDGKHKVEAELLEHSLVDVTLKLANGKSKRIKLSLMSDADKEYLKKFPELKGEPDPKNLPWVRAQAKTKNQRRFGKSGGSEYRTKQMEISVANRSKEKLELVVLHGFLIEDLHGRNASSRMIRRQDLAPEEFRIKRLTLAGQKDTKFDSAILRIVEQTANGRKYGGKPKGFIVQVYWKDQLLHGWSSDSNTNDIARDPELIKNYRSR